MENYGNFSDKLSIYFKDHKKLSFVSNDKILIATNDDNIYEFKRKSDQKYKSSTKIFDGNDSMTDIKNSIISLSEDMSTIKPLIDKSILKELCKKNC
jgi:hypothetical protein